MKKRGALFPDGEVPAKEAAPSDEIPSEEFCTSNNNGPTNDEELELELKEMAPPMDEQAWTGFFFLITKLSPTNLPTLMSPPLLKCCCTVQRAWNFSSCWPNMKSPSNQSRGPF